MGQSKIKYINFRVLSKIISSYKVTKKTLKTLAEYIFALECTKKKDFCHSFLYYRFLNTFKILIYNFQFSNPDSHS